MQHHIVDPRCPGVRPGGQADRRRDDAIGLALRRAQFRHAERLPAIFAASCRCLRQQVVGQPQQIGGAAPAHGDRGHHGHAERLGKTRHIDGDAAPCRDVEHVEHQHQRPAGALQLKQQADGEAQIGGVGDAQHQIGQRLAGGASEHDVARNLLVRAAAAQRIGAGQVDQRHLPAHGRDEGAFLALDGDARIIRDLLPAAGQRIEQRGLAAVGRAHQGKMHQGSFHGAFPFCRVRRR